MKQYILLLRGINVGGKNKLPMAELKRFLERQGCSNVTTYIQSGNVILESALDKQTLKQQVEKALPKSLKLDSSIIRILILTFDQLQSIINNKPRSFGEQPEKYHSDVIFLIDVSVGEAIKVFSPKEGVDTVWQGDGVIYSQRLSTMRTKSRLNKIVGTIPYQSMTIRNWNTVTKLLELSGNYPYK